MGGEDRGGGVSGSQPREQQDSVGGLELREDPVPLLQRLLPVQARQRPVRQGARRQGEGYPGLLAPPRGGQDGLVETCEGEEVGDVVRHGGGGASLQALHEGLQAGSTDNNLLRSG